VIRGAPEYLRSYAGQVAVLTAANLLGRMARRVALAIPRMVMVPPLPWAGDEIAEFACAQMQAADPRGEYLIRPAIERDHIVFLGASGAPVVTHGAGWLAWHGPGPSPLPADDTANHIGAALAVIAAGAQLAANGFEAPPSAVLLNSFDWSHEFGVPLPTMPSADHLGSLWAVGIGSVGTAILYFLTLMTRNFSTLLFDRDKVKRENITRSPVFADGDIGMGKAEVAEAYLKRCGMADVSQESVMLHESRRWTQRSAGTPDLVIAAGNEFNVRYLIESMFPPVQIYGTTGRNWQASVIRHMPMVDACSCCLFPEGTFMPTSCATDSNVSAGGDQQVDASLPHLSFAAGLMAAAEILKLAVPGYAMAPNRSVLYTKQKLRLAKAGVPLRQGCLCGARSRGVHEKMIAGSRYARLLR
jgi:molybdopterin/thiamine biosynthesis adenylyltransferase